MPMRWFRVYTDLLNKRKFQRLPDVLKVGLLNLWCLAAKYDGVLPEPSDIAFELRQPEEALVQMLDQLKAAGFLDQSERGLVPHDWNQHQFISDLSTGRVKRFRERRGNTAKQPAKLGGNANRNENETAAETPNETEVQRRGNVLEQSRAEQSRNRAEARARTGSWVLRRRMASRNSRRSTPNQSVRSRLNPLVGPTSDGLMKPLASTRS
jgi:hypothetical protein